MTDRPRKAGFSLAETVRWVIVTLVQMCRDRAWGEIRITVQGGQIEFVHKAESFRDRLPNMAGTDADRAVQLTTQAVAAVGS